MLIEFRVANHRSIRDEQVFTMEAGRTSEVDAPHVRSVKGHKKPLVSVAAIYGANASGKSNLLSALAFMRTAVNESHRFWDPTGAVPRDPFAWGPDRQQPSLYEVTFLHDGVRHQYGFVVDDERVLEEWLYAWPGARKQVWFEREEKFKFGEHLKGENRLVETVTRPNGLFLSAAAQNAHQQLSGVYRWITLIRIGGAALWDKTLDLDGAMADGLKRMLRVADVGISDFKIQEGEQGARPRVHFLHKNDAGDAWLPMEDESSGTLSLLKFAGPVLDVLSRGGVLIIDELERSLHPLLALYILNQFEDRNCNPKHAQLIFTTHDTNLLGTTLGESPLARDQVWLTEKDQNGASVVYPLTDYKPRKAENVERGYLQGRYGAIPFVGRPEPMIE